ncbi:hypothetical protein [Kitasatospora sp. NPDC004531]
MPHHHNPPRWPLLALRITASLIALLALLMPILAGGFLQGYYPLLDAHMQAGLTLGGACLLATLAGVLAWKLSGTPGRAAIQYGVLSVVSIVQLAVGFQRVLLLHVPLGVGIFVLAEKFAIDAFKLTATRPEEPTEPAEPDTAQPDTAQPAAELDAKASA